MTADTTRFNSDLQTLQGRRPRVLWVTEEVPGQHLGGGSIRQAHLFVHLARVADLHLLTVGTLEDERVRRAAASVTQIPKPAVFRPRRRTTQRLFTLALLLLSREPGTIYPARGPRKLLARKLRSISNGFDIVLVEHEALAPLLPRSRRGVWIVTFHHLLSAMHATEASRSFTRRQRWLWRRERQKALRLERRAIRGYDVAIACSSEDAGTLANMRATSQSADITTVPNGVDVEAISPTPIPLPPRLLFPGTLSYRPNVDGAVWFCDEVLPRIRQRIPEVSLSIAGRTPVQEVLALARLPGVSIQANVPSMTTHFEATRAVVVPIRIGTGTRLKALEALAAGRPVVGTTIGLEGLGLIDGVQARIADEPEEMASAIVEVLLADDVALQLAQAGRKHVEGQFSWDRIGVLFAGVLARALKARVAAGPDAASGIVIDR